MIADEDDHRAFRACDIREFVDAAVCRRSRKSGAGVPSSTGGGVAAMAHLLRDRSPDEAKRSPGWNSVPGRGPRFPRGRWPAATETDEFRAGARRDRAGPVTTAWFRKMMARLGEGLACRLIHPHMLRHSCGF